LRKKDLEKKDLLKTVIEETRGETLVYNGSICDARFSKCCGGAMETFENVWEPIAYPYLQGKADTLDTSLSCPISPSKKMPTNGFAVRLRHFATRTIPMF